MNPQADGSPEARQHGLMNASHQPGRAVNSADEEAQPGRKRPSNDTSSDEAALKKQRSAAMNNCSGSAGELSDAEEDAQRRASSEAEDDLYDDYADYEPVGEQARPRWWDG